MAKIAISLPDAILQDIENERLAIGETRSEFIRRAVEAYFVLQRKVKDSQEYIRGYLNAPETSAELGWVEGAAQNILKEYPWDDEAK
ncbi:MAG: hypothetical protein IIB31_05035 [Chloroflexi bacterium]|nr:hypothetical protein [Chloroflexota bacterium]